MKHEPDQAAPTNWITLVNDRCDLDLAFEALDGWDHFHTDTIRGRILSLQLRPEEAWTYFDRAGVRSEEYGSSLRNLLRRFYLKAYRFENALIMESGQEGGDIELTERCLRDLLCGETPDSDIASQIQTYNHALYLLNREDFVAAKKLLKRLLRQSRDRLGDEKTGFYFGAAVAFRSLGEEEEAERQMENACLYIPTLDNTFNMGYYAAEASALLRLWGRAEDASEWEAFLLKLKVPNKTAELFRERTQRIMQRSEALNHVFLF